MNRIPDMDTKQPDASEDEARIPDSILRRLVRESVLPTSAAANPQKAQAVTAATPYDMD